MGCIVARLAGGRLFGLRARGIGRAERMLVGSDAAAALLVDAPLALRAADEAMLDAAATLLFLGFRHHVGALRIVLGAATALALHLLVVAHPGLLYTDENCVPPNSGATLVVVI